ncbi:hypothetical protein PAMC26510_35890 [Caballeronia sordidicola]|uniref:Uncharacterized protein n=1 Tax=Caballeronia sordidicola TaxID=196367 RepID=A0A242M530_CABSO|nr:hypothetical protein PAMC26510_35890 [Caballeronia sordidicola]OXC79291.1 hypothetical protein BSU04_07535 [Caballeronia sordidicola]
MLKNAWHLESLLRNSTLIDAQVTLHLSWANDYNRPSPPEGA